MIERDKVYVATCPFCGSRMIFGSYKLLCTGEKNKECYYQVKSKQIEEHNTLVDLLDELAYFISDGADDGVRDTSSFHRLRAKLSQIKAYEDKI